MRDKAIQLAKLHPDKALLEAKKTKDPWYRAQALSWVLRYTPENNVKLVLQLAKKAAKNTNDAYQQSAVRAWEIVALAERGLKDEARKSLNEALARAKDATPESSRSEAFILLIQAAVNISQKDSEHVVKSLHQSCKPENHWRCKRAFRDAKQILKGERQARSFF